MKFSIFLNRCVFVMERDMRNEQDKIFRRKRLSTGANFVHVYVEVWDNGILKFNKFIM